MLIRQSCHIIMSKHVRKKAQIKQCWLVSEIVDPYHTHKHLNTCIHTLLLTFTIPKYILTLTDSEGWFFGSSQNSGMSGLYPGNYVEKTKDSDCWTLHRYT